MRIKICHLTTVHNRFDIRIYRKMCVTLAHEGYDVNLIVADGLGDETVNGIKIFDIGKSVSRMQRIRKFPHKMYKKALELNADMYHFHDPELVGCGLRLRKQNKIVIMDAHEDFPKQLLGKPYMNRILKISLSKAFSVFESLTSNKFSYVICATDSIGIKYQALTSKVVVVNNYPLVNELFAGTEYNTESKDICYVGAISKIRGIQEVVHAIEISTQIRYLKIAGKFNDQYLYHNVQSYQGWDKVEELGVLDRDGVRNLMSECAAGIVTFLPQENHIDSQPNKMFEYMSAGIPVIASHFPLWKDLIEGNNCGICVDPENPSAISRAIDTLLNDPAGSKKMGENGRSAILGKYNWDVEKEKLIKVYDELSNTIKVSNYENMV